MFSTLSVFVLGALAAPVEALGASVVQRSDAPAREAGASARPSATFAVTKVVDGDTLWIERAGETEKLRLLSVDTEERLELGDSLSESKPGTPFGSECEEWARAFFAARARDGAAPRVGLAFPGGREARDVYGRLLCHVLLEDGTDFNVLLVREGKSPYFDKYGYSEIAHEAFVRAEEEARAARRGIWDPKVNEGAARRPYERLLPWWEARALAVAGFRAASAEKPGLVVSAEEPEPLEAALLAAHPRIEAFGTILRFFDEDDGSLTVLFRGGDARRSLRVRIAAEERAAYAALDLAGTTRDFTQNYLYVSGRLARGPRGFELLGVRPADWRRGGPEPLLPEGQGRKQAKERPRKPADAPREGRLEELR